MVVSLNCLSHTNTQHDSQTRTGVDSGQEGSGKTYEEALLLLLSWRHISLYKVTIHPVSIVKKKGRSNEKQLYVPSLTCSIYVQYTNARVCVCVCVRVRSLSGEGYNVLFLCPCFFFLAAWWSVCTLGNHIATTLGRSDTVYKMYHWDPQQCMELCNSSMKVWSISWHNAFEPESLFDKSQCMQPTQHARNQEGYAAVNN